ncbi:unnamed protein product [Lactuca saligna]|uniref:Uncharacterized protein n=1 Tax=Lactuca saligna TaxID=75948 RepID=A0AA36EA64_LACSI|nr:unnamed protein product [Lactuca saligna]
MSFNEDVQSEHNFSNENQEHQTPNEPDHEEVLHVPPINNDHINHEEIPPAFPVNHEAVPPPIRRSNRNSTQPTRLKDYICYNVTSLGSIDCPTPAMSLSWRIQLDSLDLRISGPYCSVPFPNTVDTVKIHEDLEIILTCLLFWPPPTRKVNLGWASW